jgi:Putative prokaryotic signal transducing protein
MVKLIEPLDQGELAFITSLLEANGIRYFVQNEHFGSLYPGLPSVGSVVMVDEADVKRAGKLIGRLVKRQETDAFGQVRRLRQ